MAGICYRKPAITRKYVCISETNLTRNTAVKLRPPAENSKTILYSRNEQRIGLTVQSESKVIIQTLQSAARATRKLINKNGGILSIS